MFHNTVPISLPDCQCKKNAFAYRTSARDASIGLVLKFVRFSNASEQFIFHTDNQTINQLCILLYYS
jgi:hypothetical protein